MQYFPYIPFLAYCYSPDFKTGHSSITVLSGAYRNLSLLKIVKSLGFESSLAVGAHPVDSRELLHFFTDTQSLWPHFHKGGKSRSSCVSVKRVSFLSLWLPPMASKPYIELCDGILRDRTHDICQIHEAELARFQLLLHKVGILCAEF